MRRSKSIFGLEFWFFYKGISKLHILVESYFIDLSSFLFLVFLKKEILIL